MSTAALFGRVRLTRQYCPNCDTEAFVVDNTLKCCDRKIEGKISITRVQRETDAVNQRLAQSAKDRILQLQHYRCYICGTDLRCTLWYKKKKRFKPVTVQFDHFIPKSFCPNNDTENIYAMCNLCNQHKGSKMYDDREAAKKDIISRRESLGLMELYSATDIEVLKEIM